MTGHFLPYGQQHIDDDDVTAVVAALKREFLTTGPTVSEFEKAFAAVVDAPFAVSCSSGTAGLHLATLAAGLGPGDVAIVPSVTFLATANAVRYVGAEVTFADVDPDTGLMRVEDFEAALSRARKVGVPKAVLPVHLGGQPADMTEIGRIAQEQGLYVIEDACHAIGSSYDGRTTGTCLDGDMAVFSFHPVKLLTTAEGGMLTCRDPALHLELKRLRSHGIIREASEFSDRAAAFDADGSPNPWYYEMPRIGFNYRLPDLLCALGLSQLKKQDRFLARRQALADFYDRALQPLAPLLRPVPRRSRRKSGWHLYAVLIDFAAAGISRARLINRLRTEFSVGTQVHYIPVHRQPYYRQRYGDQDLPGAARYYERALSLPLYPHMTDEDAGRVVQALATILGRVCSKGGA